MTNEEQNDLNELNAKLDQLRKDAFAFARTIIAQSESDWQEFARAIGKANRTKEQAIGELVIFACKESTRLVREHEHKHNG
jgi:hypothetical protein